MDKQEVVAVGFVPVKIIARLDDMIAVRVRSLTQAGKELSVVLLMDPQDVSGPFDMDNLGSMARHMHFDEAKLTELSQTEIDQLLVCPHCQKSDKVYVNVAKKIAYCSFCGYRESLEHFTTEWEGING